MDNNEKILKALELGNFFEHEGIIPRRIITAISNLFIFGDKVYKIYKSDNDFSNKSFDHLPKKERRFIFTKQDFIWNNKFSPEIYVEVKPIRISNNKVVLANEEDADDMMIVMNKIDMSNSLINLLMENRITLEDCYKIGFQLVETERLLSNFEKDINLRDDFISRYHDLLPWISCAEKYISKEEIKKYTDIFLNLITKNENTFRELNHLSGPCMDVHADNAVFSGGKILLMDTYPTQERWMYGYKYISIYRIASDIYAFLGKEHFDKVIKGYEDAAKVKLPRELDTFMVFYCELIMIPYQYMLSENNSSRLSVAERYFDFLKKISLTIDN